MKSDATMNAIYLYQVDISPERRQSTFLEHCANHFHQDNTIIFQQSMLHQIQKNCMNIDQAIQLLLKLPNR